MNSENQESSFLRDNAFQLVTIAIVLILGYQLNQTQARLESSLDDKNTMQVQMDSASNQILEIRELLKETHKHARMANWHAEDARDLAKDAYENAMGTVCDYCPKP